MTDNTTLKSAPEISSLLSQMSNLQTDKERLAKELERLVQENSSLKQNKREEMQKIFDTLIHKWLEASVNDENARKQFTEGMGRIIEKTQDQGVWTVAVEASHLHARQIEELEKLRAECEQLRAHSNEGGSFKDEAARKRPREETKTNDFWAGFTLDS